MEREKHKETLARKLMEKDPSVYLVKPEKSSKSCAWGADCFSLIFNNNVKENYVYCQICNNLITYNSVHGTGSLLRHHCYKKVMNLQKEENIIVKSLNITATPKVLKRSRGNDHNTLDDNLINSPESLKFQIKARDNTKQKKEIEELIARGDPSIDMRAPENIKSEVWSNGNFKILYQNGKKLDFVMCLFCHSLITYKSKTGTASLLRHSCIKRLTETIKRENGSPQQDENIHEYVTIPISETEEHADDVDTTQTTSVADNLSYVNENDADQDSSMDYPDTLRAEILKVFHYFGFLDMQSTNLANRKGLLGFGQYFINVGAEYRQIKLVELLDSKHTLSPSYASESEKYIFHIQEMLRPKFEDHKIALSCDYWTDPNRKMNFITLYGHYISDMFEIKKVNLGTVSFVESFQSIDYKQSIVTMLENYFACESDIDAFLSNTTTVVFDEMTDCFKSLQTVSCSCSTLNRIVLQLIDECGLRKVLPSDVIVSENWSNVWEYLEMGDDNIDSATLDEFKQILDPFAKAVRSLSSDQKPTINEVYIFRKKIEDHFRNTRFSNGKIRDVALNLIREHFPITNLHKIAVFLDPRFKSLKFMSHEEKTNVLSIVSKMVSSDDGDGNVIAFGEDIDDKSAQVSIGSKTGVGTMGGDTTDSTKYLIEYMDIVEERDETHDEVDVYVNLKFNDIYSANILEFWESRYDLPHLRQLARDILCIPASGIVAEKIFSDDANLLCKRRLNMEIENMKQMLHIHENSELWKNLL